MNSLIKNSDRLLKRIYIANAFLFLTAMFSAPSQAAPVAADTLQITENSSTSLAVMWNGAPITPVFVANDHWTFTLPTQVRLGLGEGTGGAAVPEPEAVIGQGPWNNVFTSTDNSHPFVNLVDVQSDSRTTDPFAIPALDNVPTMVGFDASGLPIALTFHDAGDGQPPSVPDQSSTALLLFISIFAFFAARHFQRVPRA